MPADLSSVTLHERFVTCPPRTCTEFEDKGDGKLEGEIDAAGKKIPIIATVTGNDIDLSFMGITVSGSFAGNGDIHWKNGNVWVKQVAAAPAPEPGPLTISETFTDQLSSVAMYKQIMSSGSDRIEMTRTECTTADSTIFAVGDKNYCHAKSPPTGQCTINKGPTLTKTETSFTMGFSAKVVKESSLPSSCCYANSCVGGYVRTIPYSFSTGDKVEFEWRAEAGGDDYEVGMALIDEFTGEVVDKLVCAPSLLLPPCCTHARVHLCVGILHARAPAPNFPHRPLLLILPG